MIDGNHFTIPSPKGTSPKLSRGILSGEVGDFDIKSDSGRVGIQSFIDLKDSLKKRGSIDSLSLAS